jgi:hypothetical protein
MTQSENKLDKEQDERLGQSGAELGGAAFPVRHHLPDIRPPMTHKFNINGCEG